MVISPVHFPQYRSGPRTSRGNSFFDTSRYFGRGSWALAYGIMAIAKKRGKHMARVWLPDYFCKEPLEILAQFPIVVDYYPMKKNLEPDRDTLNTMCARQERPDAIVLVHYFGFPNNVAEAKTFCDARGIELIEDCAHVMNPYQEVGRTGGCAVFSPWKFLPIPLLGALQVRESLRDFVPILYPRHRALFGIRWCIKREMQRMLCAMGVNWYAKSHKSSLRPAPPTPLPRGEDGRVDARSGEELRASPDTFSLRLLKHYMGQVDYIRARRRQNYKALETFLKERYPEMLLFKNLPDSVTPYLFSLILKEPAKKYVDELIRRGIPAVQWPALPDVVRVNPERFPTAHFYAEHLMLLPVHQNVSKAQIEYMKGQIQEVIR